MSHTVKILSQFKNLKALSKGFNELGWQLTNNSKLRSYNNHDTKVYTRAAVNPEVGPNAYDVGIEDSNGVYELFSDTFGGSVERSLGVGFSRLKVATKRIEIEQYAEENGYDMVVKNLENGGVEIEIAHT